MTAIHKLFWSALLLALFPALSQAQVKMTRLSRSPELVTLHWQGGFGPYQVETSRDLLAWSNQGEPVSGLTQSLSALANRGFYRVIDLNSANLLGAFFGLIQTDQGEFGGLLGRHRLKSRLWLYKTKGAPHTSTSYVPSNYWRKLLVHFQYHEGGLVKMWSGALENLGTVATPTTQRMTVVWTRGSGATLRSYTLTMNFPYSVNASRTAAPRPSDPTYTLSCTYATAQPELNLDTMTMRNVFTENIELVQLDPDNPSRTSYPVPRNYHVIKNGVNVHLHFHEGLPLYQGSPPFIFKTFLLDRWLSPTTSSGGSVPAFKTDSYYSRTLLPGHHNFLEIVLIEPALDPALSEATRQALAAANIRYLYTFKDIDIGLTPDDIRLIGFDHSVRLP